MKDNRFRRVLCPEKVRDAELGRCLAALRMERHRIVLVNDRQRRPR